MNQLGVVIGRFQVHEIHAAHLQLLETVQADNHNMLILLGCPKAPPTKANPLGYLTRQIMLQELFPAATILPVFDMPDDQAWSKQVDELVHNIYPGISAVLYGGRDSFIPHYSGRYKTRTLDWGDGDQKSGSTVRQALADRALNTPEWRAGVIWTLAHTLPRTYNTVDIAYCKDIMTGPSVLLGKRPGALRWRFPGGFVDPAETPQQAARRELREETTFVAEHDPRLIDQLFIDDWRSRGQDDVAHMTHFYLVEHCFGALPARGKDLDDLGEVAWFRLHIIDRRVVEPEHLPLIERLQKHLASTALGEPANT